MIGEIKRWLVAQGFSERVASLVMWQAGILLLIVAVLVMSRHPLDGIAIAIVLLLLFMPLKYHLVDGMLILLMLFFILLALAAEPMLGNYLR